MSTRKELLRWIGWFAALNTGVFCLLGLRYLFIYQFPAELPGTVYALLAFVGQFAALAGIPLFLVLVPVALLIPNRRLVKSLGVLMISAGLSLLLLDTQVFAQYRFHMTRLTMEIFEPGTWAFAALMFLIFLFLQSMLAGMVWRRLKAGGNRRLGRWVAAGLAVCWLGGTVIHIWGDAVAHVPVTRFTRFLPLYYPVHAKRDLARLGLVDPEKLRQRRLIRGSMDPAAGRLRYPISPMSCKQDADHRLNVLLVLIDALRPDAVTGTLTPNLARFRTQGLDFEHHYSGGNSSRMGIFSMFYGLPATYWQSFDGLQKAPVLMDQIRAAGYEQALFSAVGFGSPTSIDRTVFAGQAGLPDENHDLSASARNIAVTDDWLAWLAGRDFREPFFGFLYYDPPLDEMPVSGEPLPMDERFAANQAAKDRWHQYRLAMQLVDGEVGRVMHSLEQRRLPDHTVVLLVSDHGYEFDDNGLGYIGHAGNFSAAQLHATFLVHWPGKTPAVFSHRTSHHDLPVTLLQEVFNCSNPVDDYAVGRNLFSGESWDWIMAGSYTAHAIVQPDKVIVSHPGGFMEVLGEDYRPVGNAELDAGLIQESMLAMRRFFP